VHDKYSKNANLFNAEEMDDERTCEDLVAAITSQIVEMAASCEARRKASQVTMKRPQKQRRSVRRRTPGRALYQKVDRCIRLALRPPAMRRAAARPKSAKIIFIGNVSAPLGAVPFAFNADSALPPPLARHREVVRPQTRPLLPAVHILIARWRYEHVTAWSYFWRQQA
jgi:hypothetical protein